MKGERRSLKRRLLMKQREREKTEVMADIRELDRRLGLIETHLDVIRAAHEEWKDEG